ncbi:MAG: TonB-dependent receptor [Candidatus Aminicenantes bacterium]|nr:TonB-dependent receptor [Candidatus Aminicenantes bacterium]
MLHRRFLIVVLFLLVFSFNANAQIILTGTLSGFIQEKDGNALPRVTITIVSPALIVPQMTLVTGDKGFYRFPALAPGLYKMTFTLTGFRTLVREDIRISVGETTTLNVDLELSAIQESVTVTGQSPTVDIQKTTITATYPKEFLMKVPTQRQLLVSFFSVVPGVVSETYHGAATSDNAFMIDGVNISDPLTGGLLVSYGFDIIEELAVDTGGLGAEYGNVRGAVINAITKSGGNEFHAQASYYFRNKSFQADNTAGTPLAGQFVGLKKEFDWNLNIGGPIVKNKLWFFANMSYYSLDQYVDGFPWAQSQTIPVDNWRYYPYAKLSWQVDEKSKIVLSYNHQNIRRTNRDASRYRNEDTTYLQNNPTNTFNLQGTRFFSGNFFMNAKLAYVTHKLEFEAKNDLIGIYDQVTGFYSQSYGNTNITKRPKLQFNLDGTYFVDDWMGRHEFKTGIEAWYGWEVAQNNYNVDPRYNLSNLIYLSSAVPSYILHRMDYTRKDNNIMIGGFIQDSWRLTERLTLNLGVRYDHQVGIVPEQGQDREPVVYGGVTYDPRVASQFTALTWDTISPRLGAAYALTRDNKTVVKASFGRYYSSAISTLFVGINPNGSISWRQALNPDWTLKGGPYSFSATAASQIDSDLKVPYVDEVTVGIERELLKDARLSLRYIRKWDRNQIDDVDRNALDMNALGNGELVWTNYTPYSVVDPYSGQSITFWGVTNTAIPTSMYITNPPDNTRDYESVEVTFTKRYSHRWQMTASYVYANAKNLLGLSSTGSTGLFNNPNSMTNAFGRDPLVPMHQVKIQGTYTLPWGFNISGFFYHYNGYPSTRQIRSSDLGLNLAQGTVTINAEGKGASLRPNLTNLDLRIDKSFSLPGRYGKVEFMLDIFNVFNANTATAIETRSSNPGLFTYGILTGIMAPRILRLGVRYEF